MDEVCRFCTLNCTTLENIFAERERTDNEPLLITILESCTDCEISECDSLPQNICGPCISAAKYSFEFKLRFEKSEKYFMELLSEREQLRIKFETDDICRFCTVSCTTLENIFGERERTNNETLLTIKLECLTNSKIMEEDSLPHNICGSCISAANSAFEFKVRCEQSEKYFKDLTGECEQKPEIDQLTIGESYLTENNLGEVCVKPKPNDTVYDNNFKGCSTSNVSTEDCYKEDEEVSATDESNETGDEDYLKDGFSETGELYDIEDEDERTFEQHFDERPYKCELCLKSFKNIARLKRHILTHSAKRPYKCEHCPKAFTWASNLKHHMTVHSDDRPFKCEHCSMVFKALSTLNIHQVIHSDDRPYKCEHCPKAFKRIYDLRGHMKIHSDDRPYKCEHCSLAFKTLRTLNVHKITHSDDRPYKCEHCSKTFKRVESFMRHTKTHSDNHSEDRQIHCKHCLMAFNTKKHLKNHIVSLSCPMVIKETSSN